MNWPIILTKCFHILLSSFIILFLGVFISKNVNSVYPESPKKKKKTTLKLFIDVAFFTGVLYISHYIIRNFMEKLNKHVFSHIIFWDDLIGYDTGRLKALNGGVAMAFSIFLFNEKYKKDVKALFNEKINIELKSLIPDLGTQ